MHPPMLHSPICLMLPYPNRKRKKKSSHSSDGPEFMAEPVDLRPMSFIGTREYLAPEIVSGVLEFPKDHAVPAAAKDSDRDVAAAGTSIGTP
ncbi:Serine/threonine-protein kinase AGC1-5 [Linum perenne]